MPPVVQPGKQSPGCMRSHTNIIGSPQMQNVKKALPGLPKMTRKLISLYTSNKTACQASAVHSEAVQEAASTSGQIPESIPRQRGVTDGKWDKFDAEAVAAALENAKAIVSRKLMDGKGEVLLAKSIEDLKAMAVRDGQPGYRGKQLYDGILRGARSVDEISNVPKAWREQMRERGVLSGRSIIHKEVKAKDGTRKFLLQLADGRIVETVGIPTDDSDKPRLTVCVSSQVGCPMRCSFCATGKGGFARNLAPHEIVDQVLTVQEQFGTRVNNIVFMGMGEPLLNLPSVILSQEFLNSSVGIGARHMTISTVGVPNSIRQLAQYNLQSTLAISIHASNQRLREQLIPSAKVYPLEALMLDCRQYFEVTGRRVTFEYTLLAGVNDSSEAAEELAALLQRYDLRSHVNLIPFNPVDGSEFKRPSKQAGRNFANVLERCKIPVSIRVTRGLDAAAACGQLRNLNQQMPLSVFSQPA